jgi:hypothetical protein
MALQMSITQLLTAPLQQDLQQTQQKQQHDATVDAENVPQLLRSKQDSTSTSTSSLSLSQQQHQQQQQQQQQQSYETSDRHVLTNIQNSTASANANPLANLQHAHHIPVYTTAVHQHGLKPVAKEPSTNVNGIAREIPQRHANRPSANSTAAATTQQDKQQSREYKQQQQQQQQQQLQHQPHQRTQKDTEKPKDEDEPTHIIAASGVTMCSPFYTATVKYDNETALRPSKQIKIKADVSSIENDENVPPVGDEEEGDAENEGDAEGDGDGEDEGEGYEDEILVSMEERTQEQILDETRRMSLKRQAPVEDENDQSLAAEQDILPVESEPKRPRVDYTWHDLDSGDADDPLMVSEYVNEIFEYLHELELKTLPDANYLQMQRNLRPKMRSILVDWLVEVHLKFKLLPETLYLAVNIMDRFLSKELVQVDRLQLLATGALFIAAKYEEVYSPSIKNYAYVTDGAFTEEEILGAERFILEILNFNMSFPNPMNFLRRISKADDYDVNTRTIGKYLLEITFIDHKFIGYMPSMCAAAAMFISRKMIGKDQWTGDLIHYSGGYKVRDMAQIVYMIMDYLVSPIVHEEFFKKYASKKFMKVSILARQWAKKSVRDARNIVEEEMQ